MQNDQEVGCVKYAALQLHLVKHHLTLSQVRSKHFSLLYRKFLLVFFAYRMRKETLDSITSYSFLCLHIYQCRLLKLTTEGRNRKADGVVGSFN